MLLLALCTSWAVVPATAQTGGDAAITGVVTDSSGAAIPSATLIAKNVATGVETKRISSSAGIFEISPLIVGTYELKVSAPGYESKVQEHIELHENQVFGYNPVLAVGSQQETITVSDTPPSLDTANAVLGTTIENSEFMELPILVSGNQQRDVTQFSNLLPGAQTGSRSSLFSGTANRVVEVYLDGIPMTTISQIGDNRPILNGVPSEGIGEIGALTSGQSAEYQGAGSVNYAMKTGTNSLHGTVADFVRNRIFDTWGFSAGYATIPKLVNGVVTNVPAGKPADHQNELAMGFGGPIVIPHLVNGHNKLFFYAAYDKTNSLSAPAYAATTVPTTLMRQGNFSELLTANGGPGYLIYDPTSLAACTANSTNGPCRYAYGQTAGTGAGPNGNPSGTPTNIIPAGQLSPIAQAMESFLPPPSSSGYQNNYIGGTPTGYQNWIYSGRVDYTLSPRQTIAVTWAEGHRHAVPYTSSANMIIPPPYLPSTYSTVVGRWADISHAFTITPNLVNQFKMGYSYFGGPPVASITQNVKQWEAATMGINFSGVPADGQAVTEFPYSTFSGSNAPFAWGTTSPTSTTVSNNNTTVDNLLWIKGKHAFTFGFQVQWLEENADSYDGPTSNLSLTWSTNETAAVSGSTYTSNTGYSYASFMLGAVNSTGITLQPFSVLGGRYRTFAPYVQDDYKITPKLTLNLGLRWDYLPTYHESKDRFSFLNPNLTNPVTGNPGALEFAGNWGGSGVSIGSHTPVQTYWKNWGPRLGFAYALDPKTTIRGAYSVVYSHGGGTGGAGNTYNGPSQLGFTSSPSFNDSAAGASAGPAFYLNNGTAFTSMGIANNNFGGPGYTVPAITPPGSVSQTLNVGNTVNSSGAFVTASGAPGFADPYLSGRAPEFEFWNFGVQRELMRNVVLTVNYTGTESHFIAGASNMRGKFAGQLNPIYYALGSQLTKPATAANIAAANITAAAAGLPAINLPYASFATAAGTTTGAGKATIEQALVWMPQFSGTTDTWGSQSANASYHSAQVSLEHRMSHGLTVNVNYTFSKNMDDAGTQRSGFAIPSSLMLNGKGWAVNRADRSVSANSIPTLITAYGTYKLPFGKDGIGANNFIARQLAGGWTLSAMYTYDDGTPLLVTASACTSSSQPLSGTCMPDLNPNFTGSSIRQNGKWGKGMTANNLGKTPSAGGISYANGYVGGATLGNGANGAGASVPCASATSPYCNPGSFMFGDAPRVSYGLRNPSTYNLNMGLRRNFVIVPERLQFVFAADCSNVTNHVTFGTIGVSVDSAAFGTVGSATNNASSRDFQFSGRLNF
jgi:hypothetical protein